MAWSAASSATKGSHGAALYEDLHADRDAIDREFVKAGLPAPEWVREQDGGSITLSWP